MRVFRLSIPVNFDLSFLKIRWSDRVLIKEGEKTAGEGVVYGGDWEKAEKLARQMAKMNFRGELEGLKVCEQIFISNKLQATSYKQDIKEIIDRGSNLKVKVGRNVFEDIKTLKWIRNSLNFPNSLRIDANQGYSLKQLQYVIPTLLEVGIECVEEPVKKKDLKEAVKILHKNGLKIILDETLIQIPTSRGGTRNDRLVSLRGVFDAAIWLQKIAVDAINLKLSRIGDINKAVQYIKLAKKHKIKVVIGCSEELERGMEAIYALGHIAKKEGVLLEIEGFGPLRLRSEASPLRLRRKCAAAPRWINKLENMNLILWHRVKQMIFNLWWHGVREIVLAIKKTKLLSALSLRLVKITGKSKYFIHPKHLIKNTSQADFVKFIDQNDIVLDVGCGNGQNAMKAADKAREVIGFDVDADSLNIAKRTAKTIKKSGKLEFSKASAEEPFKYKGETFNKVLLLGVLEHLADRKMTMSEIYRVLKRDGKLIMGVPNSQTSWKIWQRRFGVDSMTDPDHKIEYSKQQIEEMLTMNNFKIEKLLPTAYDTPWAGFIDLIGGIYLPLYEKIMKWKWRIAKENPSESISYLIIAEKK